MPGDDERDRDRCFDKSVPLAERLRLVADVADLPAWVEQVVFEAARALDEAPAPPALEAAARDLVAMLDRDGGQGQARETPEASLLRAKVVVGDMIAEYARHHAIVAAAYRAAAHAVRSGVVHFGGGHSEAILALTPADARAALDAAIEAARLEGDRQASARWMGELPSMLAAARGEASGAVPAAERCQACRRPVATDEQRGHPDDCDCGPCEGQACFGEGTAGCSYRARHLKDAGEPSRG
jgi:hypothetical protein